MAIYQEIDKHSESYVQDALMKTTGFREYDLRWLFGEALNERGAYMLGQGFGTFLQRDYGLDEVVVGQDYRWYAQMVKHAFCLGMVASGMNVYDIGLSISPQLYYAQYQLDKKAGAMITASHNDNGWTGFKLAYDKSRTLGPSQIKALKEIVYSEDYLSGPGTYRLVEGIREQYLNDLLKDYQGGRKLKIVVCTGNGGAGLFTPEVLRRAGHEVVEHLTDLDWDYPNFNPNPENIKFLKSIGKRVVQEKADFGIGIDGDGDRLGIVNADGHEIFSDKVGLVIAQYLVKHHQQPKIVVDVKCTALFDKLITDPKLGEVIYWKTGHSYIKQKVLDEKALAGFERSGHFFFNDPIGRGYDDANLAALMFCETLSHDDRRLTQILQAMPLSYQSPSMQPQCGDTVKYDVVARFLKTYRELHERKTPVKGQQIARLITVNGVRVEFEDESWFLVRASSNVPALVVLGESYTSRERLAEMMKEVVDRLRSYDEIGDFDQMMDFS